MANKVAYFAKDFLENGEDFVIAKVVDTHGSTPRKKGAWMIVKEDGTSMGTVGGGKLEAETQKICVETYKTKEKSKIYQFRLTGEDEKALDMRCGGDADVEIQYIDASHPEDFIEEFHLDTTAYIFGGGHVALALEPVLRYVDFNTVVIDDREEYANRERYPQARDVRVVPDFKNAFDGITTTDDSYIVIVTRGHAGDYDVLRDALKQKSAYIGMIGSKKKNAILFDKLREEGFSEEDIARVHAPIGTPIQAETPEEIAISITGEMIQVRASRHE